LATAPTAPERIVVDASVLVAIALREPGFERLQERLAESESRFIAAPNLLEAAIVLSNHFEEDPRLFLNQWTETTRTEVVPFEEGLYLVAFDAFLRFGKGRHPARLNFGDCIAYATATFLSAHLLFVGDDFAKTDVNRITR